MKRFLKSIFLIALTLPITSISAASPIGDNVDYDALADKCHTLSLQLDSLSRAQRRTTCSVNLDGLNVYFASNYISSRWITKATEVLTSAIIQIKFARDTDCNYKDDIQKIIDGLKLIRDKLNDSRQ